MKRLFIGVVVVLLGGSALWLGRPPARGEAETRLELAQLAFQEVERTTVERHDVDAVVPTLSRQGQRLTGQPGRALIGPTRTVRNECIEDLRCAGA